MTLPTILIADDDRSIRTVLTQALGRTGYQVRAKAMAHNIRVCRKLTYATSKAVKTFPAELNA